VSAYSANPKTKLASPPSLTGSAISLVSVMQVIIFFHLLSEIAGLVVPFLLLMHSLINRPEASMHHQLYATLVS
jgi:hypothetical protein